MHHCRTFSLTKILARRRTIGVKSQTYRWGRFDCPQTPSTRVVPPPWTQRKGLTDHWFKLLFCKWACRQHSTLRFSTPHLSCPPTHTKSCLATPDTPGRTAVRPYRLTFGEPGVWNSDLVSLTHLLTYSPTHPPIHSLPMMPLSMGYQRMRFLQPMFLHQRLVAHNLAGAAIGDNAAFVDQDDAIADLQHKL